MLKNIIKALESYQGLEYKITIRTIDRVESYYVRREPEMSRRAEVEHLELTVYKVFEENGKKYRGSAQAEIHPTASEAEIREIIGEAYFSAGFVKNEYYPLVEPCLTPVCGAESESGKMDLYAALNKLTVAMFAEDTADDANLSHAELFVREEKVRIVNSLGLDVRMRRYGVDVETAVHCRDEGKEIEIFEIYTLASCDTGYLSDAVRRLFASARQKVKAQPTPSGLDDINVLLSGECLKVFFSYYCYNSNTASIYNKESTYEIGCQIQDEAEGDLVTMTLDPFLSGSDASRPYDDDGFPLKRTEVIKDGKLTSLWGGKRFSHYLGVEPTGVIENYIISGGTHSLCELRAEPYIELVSFSDFQIDEITGDFASEIRLGLLYDGKTVKPITGGSVSGNIKKVHNAMKMSLETRQFNNYVGPEAILIKNVTIAGS